MPPAIVNFTLTNANPGFRGSAPQPGSSFNPLPPPQQLFQPWQPIGGETIPFAPGQLPRQLQPQAQPFLPPQPQFFASPQPQFFAPPQPVFVQPSVPLAQSYGRGLMGLLNTMQALMNQFDRLDQSLDRYLANQEAYNPWTDPDIMAGILDMMADNSGLPSGSGSRVTRTERNYTETSHDGDGNGGTVWGDPHYITFGFGPSGRFTFDFQGKKDANGQTVKGIYNNIETQNFRFNSQFRPWGSTYTVNGDLGFMFRTPDREYVKVRYSVDSNKLEIMRAGSNTWTELKQEDPTVNIKTSLRGKPDENGDRPFINATVKWNNANQFTINSGEYIITVSDRGGYVDFDTEISSLGSRADNFDIQVDGQTRKIDDGGLVGIQASDNYLGKPNNDPITGVGALKTKNKEYVAEDFWVGSYSNDSRDSLWGSPTGLVRFDTYMPEGWQDQVVFGHGANKHATSEKNA